MERSLENVRILKDEINHIQRVVGGIPLLVIGLGELATHKELRGVFLLHGRKGNKERMMELAQKIHLECSNSKTAVIVFCFDLRNHGDRTHDCNQNLSWDEGNINFAMGRVIFNVDMYGIILGTAFDISFLMKIIPVTLNKNISNWACAGFSLGAHVTNMAVAHEPLLKVGVSICGNADYETMMIARASESGHEIPPSSYKYISEKLLSLVEANDPVALDSNFKGKKLLHLGGGYIILTQ